MPSASVRFYGSLNDFQPVARRQATLVCAFDMYWQGSPYSRMRLFIETAFAAAMRPRRR